MRVSSTGSGKRSVLAGFLSIFATVRRGEESTGLLLMLNVFILLMAYYILKPVREALILGGAGAEIKAYAGAAQALLFVLIVPFYAALANRVNRIWLINSVTAFFISNLVIFFLLGQLKFSLGVPFFLWVGLFNLMLVAQFWAFTNDIYSQEQGKRLFVIVGIGSSLGAIVGARLAGWLFEPLGSYAMMLLAAGLLVVCLVLTNMIHHREKNRAGLDSPSPESVDQDRPLGTQGGFELVFKHRYLLLIAVLVLLSNFVNTTGEFILSKTVTQHASAATAATGGNDFNPEQYIGQFYANFFFWVNLLSAGLQMFAVSRIMKYLGIGTALFFLPVIALGSYTLVAFLPVLGFIRIAKIFENSIDYSVQNTARHALFLQTSRDAKYKAKAAIDTFFWRGGDTLSAVLVFIGTQFALNIRGFAIVNLILVILWVCVAIGISRLRKKHAAPPQALAA